MTHISTKEFQSRLTPGEALNLLKEGNARYQRLNGTRKDYTKQIEATTTGQFPFAAILSCIDSRVPAEILFDQGVGDLFNARIAGNFANTDILGSLEFACKVAGAKIIVVMGHTSCGAIKSACDHVELGNITHMLSNIKPALEEVEAQSFEPKNSSNEDFVQKVADVNVVKTISVIKDKSPILNEMLENGEIDIVGAMYDVTTGEVIWL